MRHFFYSDGNLQLLQYSFIKGIPIRQFNPACCGIFAWSGLVNVRKIPCDRKCFLPDFFTCCYSGADGLIPKGQLIISSRSSSDGVVLRGRVKSGRESSSSSFCISVTRTRDTSSDASGVLLSSVPGASLSKSGKISLLSSALAGVAV